jgi:hypothetical protein
MKLQSKTHQPPTRRSNNYSTINEKSAAILKYADLSLTIRKQVADANNVHINTVRKIISGNAPLNHKNLKVFKYLITLCIGSIKTDQEKITKHLDYFNSSDYETFIQQADEKVN